MVSLLQSPTQTIFTHKFGSLTYDTALDLRGVQWEQLIRFTPSSIEVYPDGSPSVGTELNRPATIHLNQVQCVGWEDRENCQILEQGDSGITFRVQHFTKFCFDEIVLSASAKKEESKASQAEAEADIQRINAEAPMVVEEEPPVQQSPLRPRANHFNFADIGSSDRKLATIATPEVKMDTEVEQELPWHPPEPVYQPTPNRFSDRFSLSFNQAGQFVVPKANNRMELCNLAQVERLPENVHELLLLHLDAVGRPEAYDAYNLPQLPQLDIAGATSMWKKIAFQLLHVDHREAEAAPLAEGMQYHLAETWLLMTALFGDSKVNCEQFAGDLRYADEVSKQQELQQSDEADIKRSFETWLKLAAANEVDLIISQTPDAYQRIVYRLAANQIDEALKECIGIQAFQLSAIITQSSTMQNKSMIEEILKGWRETNAIDHNVPQGVIQIFEMMSSDKPTNDLTSWRLALGLITWINSDINETLRNIFERFQDVYSQQVNLSSIFSDRVRDLHYCLTHLHCQPIEFTENQYRLPHDLVREILHPKSHINNMTNLHAFLLWDSMRVVYSAQRFTQESHEIRPETYADAEMELARYQDVGERLAGELELQGEWQWAIYILLYLKSPYALEVLHRNMRLYNCTDYEAQETGAKLTFLQEELGFPAEVIEDAKAAHAERVGQYDKALSHYANGQNLRQAHILLLSKVAPDYVIKYQGSELYQRLKVNIIDEILGAHDDVELAFISVAEKTKIYSSFCDISNLMAQENQFTLVDLQELRDLVSAINTLSESEITHKIAASIMQETICRLIIQIELDNVGAVATQDVTCSYVLQGAQKVRESTSLWQHAKWVELRARQAN